MRLPRPAGDAAASEAGQPPASSSESDDRSNVGTRMTIARAEARGFALGRGEVEEFENSFSLVFFAISRHNDRWV